MHTGTVPCKPEYERAVIGQCLFAPETVVKQVITAGDCLFYIPQYEAVFKAIEHLHDHGLEINQVTVAERLRGEKKLDRIGGEAALAGMMNEIGSCANSQYHIEILIDYAARRKLHTLAKVTLTATESNNAKPIDIVENIYTQLIRVY